MHKNESKKNLAVVIVLLAASALIAWFFQPYQFVFSDPTSWLRIRYDPLEIYAVLLLILAPFFSYIDYWYVYPFIGVAAAGGIWQSPWFTYHAIPQKLAVFILLFISFLVFKITQNLIHPRLEKMSRAARGGTIFLLGCLSVSLAKLPVAYTNNYYANSYSYIYVPKSESVTTIVNGGNLKVITATLEYQDVQQPKPPALRVLSDTFNITALDINQKENLESQCRSASGYTGTFSRKTFQKVTYLEATYDVSYNYGISPTMPAPIPYTGYTYCYYKDHYFYALERHDAMSQKAVKYPIEYLLQHLSKTMLYDYKTTTN